MRYILSLFLLFIILPLLTTAQESRVSGKITNATSVPISGATITVKGTRTTTISSETGSFSIPLTQPRNLLVISYVGFTTREVLATGGQPLTVILEPSAADLDDVVVQAYGTTTRRVNTGSIGRVSATEIEQQPVTNPLSAIQGRVPGVLITQSSGVPGSEVRIQIRGRSSLDLSLSRNDPLYIIDNVPFEPGNINSNQLRSAATNPLTSAQGGLSPLNSINPSDIESIEVLKDADATAIYGSRGANGVILITTKRGKPGKTRFSLNSSYGVSSVSRTINMMDTKQYIAMRREAFRNDNITPTVNAAPDILTWDTSRYTNLEQLLIGRKAAASFLQASVSGGTANTQFSIAGGYNRQTNVYSSTLADGVGSARFSLNHTAPNKRFTVQFTGLYTNDRNRLITTDLTRYINLPPNFKLYDSLGNLAWSDGGVAYSSLNTINPLSLLLQPYRSNTANLSANLNLSYQLFTGFTLRVSGGYNTFTTSETVQRPRTSIDPYQSILASSEFGGSTSRSYILEPQAEYRQTLAGGNLSVLAGTTFQNRDYTSYTLTGTNYTNDLLLGSISAAGQVTATNTAYTYRYAALFGRVNYALADNTYIINLTGRKDASSRFGTDKLTAIFGAAGAAWIFTNYAVLKKNLPFLSYGKLRGSYGITGNDQIGNYKYLNLWNPTNNTYQGVPGFIPASLYNADYSWEINKKAEAALELGFFKDRLLLSAAYYRNRSSNQITTYILPSIVGFENVVRNFPALVQNTGLELLLSGKIIRSANWEWSSALNMTLPRNVLLSFPGLATSSYATTYEEGKSLSVIRAYEYLGVDPQTGIYQYTDVNKDGSINSKDILSFGNLDAPLYGGFQNTLRYKGAELSLFFEFRKQTGRNYLAQLSAPTPGADLYNQPLIALDRWTQAGDNQPIQRYATYFNTAANIGAARLSSSNGIYSDASYIRCKNISLSYGLPASLLKTAHLESFRLFLHLQNLFVLTKYKGTDPESQNFYVLPPLRSIVGGLQLTF